MASDSIRAALFQVGRLGLLKSATGMLRHVEEPTVNQPAKWG